MKYGKEWDTRENNYRAAIRILREENSRWEERYRKEAEQRNLTEQRLTTAQELLNGMISSEQRKDMNHLEEKRKLIQLLMIKDSDLFQCVFDNSGGNNGQSCGDKLKQLWQKNEKFVKKWLRENKWKNHSIVSK